MEIRHAHEKIAIKNCYTGNALQGMHYDEIAKNDLAGFHVTGKKGRREIHRTKYVRWGSGSLYAGDRFAGAKRKEKASACFRSRRINRDAQNAMTVWGSVRERQFIGGQG
jgi:hypothetical protein